MTPDDLVAIRARAEAATEGPWAWASHTTVDGDEWAVFDPADHALASNRDGWGPDAEFIAHARTDVPALLAEVERLTREWGKAVRTAEDLADEVTNREYERDALAAKIEQVRSAIRLISPDHITPQGVRILNATLADPKEDT